MHFKTLLGKIISVLGRYGTIRRFAATSVAVTANEIGRERKLMLVVAKNLSHACCQHGCGQQPKVWRYKNEHEHISVVCALCLPVIVPRTCVFLLHWSLFFMSVSACQEQWSNKVRRNAEELSFGICHFELSRLPASSAGGNGVGLLGGFRAVCQIHTRGANYVHFLDVQGQNTFQLQGFRPLTP